MIETNKKKKNKRQNLISKTQDLIPLIMMIVTLKLIPGLKNKDFT